MPSDKLPLQDQIFIFIDFTIRIFVNPRFAPSLIVGQWVVRQQQAEWAGAPQKRFAWAIGLALALAMLYLMVLNNVIGPINLIVCATCLTLPKPWAMKRSGSCTTTANKATPVLSTQHMTEKRKP